MRIAIWHNLGSGGGKRALYNHVKALKEYGHYLEAWTTDLSSSDYLPLSVLIKENRKDLKNKFERLLKIRNPIRKEKQIISLINEHCIECIKEIESQNFDLIFANSCVITYMPYIGKFTKLPRIVYLGEPKRFLYEAMPDNVWQTPYDKFRINKIKRYLMDYFVNYSRRIIVRNEVEAAKSYSRILVNSLFSRENVIRSYGVDSTVCYLGVDLDDFKPRALTKEPYVVGLGSITFLKSVHNAIEIIGAIPKSIRPRLKWITNYIDQTYLEEVLENARRLEVEFIIYENVPDTKLINIVSTAAIMLYTSRLEPFGLAPLEANACGTYVVAIAEGGVRESITNEINGTLINGFKIYEIAEVIKLFVTDVNLAKTKGETARDFVNKNWNKKLMAKNILFEIESVVS